MDGENTDRAFARSLGALKRHGCSLLITGSDRNGSQRQLSRQLLGDDDTATRWRLIVATDTSGIGAHSPDTDEKTYRLIDRRPAMRNNAVSGDTPSQFTLPALEREMRTTICEFDVDADGLSPGELRVCVDSLKPLLDRHGVRAVKPFLETITGQIREKNGMGHFHLPVDREHALIEELLPLFDIQIELRDGTHRWHLVEDDIQTEWLRI